jgi:hypothetical protein
MNIDNIYNIFKQIRHIMLCILNSLRKIHMGKLSLIVDLTPFHLQSDRHICSHVHRGTRFAYQKHRKGQERSQRSPVREEGLRRVLKRGLPPV